MTPKRHFELTDHAKQRMEERGCPDPNSLVLRTPGINIMKRIRKSCKYHHAVKRFGINKRVFFYNNGYVYVCVQTDVAKYMVLTCWNYN